MIYVYVLTNDDFHYFTFFRSIDILSLSNETEIITHEADQLLIQFKLQCLSYVLCNTICHLYALTLLCMPLIT